MAAMPNPTGLSSQPPVNSFLQDEVDDTEHADRHKNAESYCTVPNLMAGDRCLVSPTDGGPSRNARVMYVGSVPGMPTGYWVGVQYDDKVGKNDGSIQGRRYFRCPPGHGGFLRPSRVVRTSDLAEKESKPSAPKEPESMLRASSLSPGGKGRRALEKAMANSAQEASATSITPSSAAAGVSPSGAGRASAARSYATGTGLGTATVGSIAQFTIVACDATGQRLSKGGDNFRVV
jgi:hypothetical protein